MSAPSAKLTVTQRYALKDMSFERSGAVPAGRVMFCKGRKILGYGDVTDLERVKTLTDRGVTTVCLSATDYDDVKRWLA